ncbi:MAG: type II secretion system protein [Candidatus Eisenbacteria bacterium]
MERKHPTTRRKGISLGELLIVLGIIAITAIVVLLNFANTHSLSREAALEENLGLLREALDLYREDHGWYPCDPLEDWNRAGDPETLKLQLTGYTNESGKPSASRSPEHPFGPYLSSWPVEPVSGSGQVAVDRTNKRIFDRMADLVAVGSGEGGWHYEPRSGNICANLGNGYPSDYAHY